MCLGVSVYIPLKNSNSIISAGNSLHLEKQTEMSRRPFVPRINILVIVLTRAAPALQYHFLCCCFFLVGLVVYSFVIFLLCCYGIAAQYFGFSNFGSQNTTSVQNVVLGSA